MTGDDDDVRVTHLVPDHVKNAAQANTDHGELSEMVRSLYKRVAHGDADGGAESIELELERVRSKKDELREEIRQKQNELQSYEQQETRLEEKLSTHRSREDKYEGTLETLEQSLYDGTHLGPDHGGVENAAKTVGKTEEEVIEELKERNPDVPDYAFKPIHQAEYRWTGLDEEDPQ